MPHKRLKKSLHLLAVAILAALLLGTVIFTVLEGWSPIDAFYFVTMTATTVGYGDFTPSTPLTKVITVVYSLAIIPFILFAFSVLARYQVERIYRKVSGLERQQKEYEEELNKTDRQIKRNKRLMKEQQEELEGHQNKIRKQQKQIQEQEELMARQHRKLQEQTKINKEQAAEIQEHDKELEVVEDIVGKNTEKKKKLAHAK